MIVEYFIIEPKAGRSWNSTRLFDKNVASALQ